MIRERECVKRSKTTKEKINSKCSRRGMIAVHAHTEYGGICLKLLMLRNHFVREITRNMFNIFSTVCIDGNGYFVNYVLMKRQIDSILLSINMLDTSYNKVTLALVDAMKL